MKMDQTNGAPASRTLSIDLVDLNAPPVLSDEYVAIYLIAVPLSPRKLLFDSTVMLQTLFYVCLRYPNTLQMIFNMHGLSKP